jgi:hypothetical protein
MDLTSSGNRGQFLVVAGATIEAVASRVALAAQPDRRPGRMPSLAAAWLTIR